jgi:putative ABC transport system ATP-binding protein
MTTAIEARDLYRFYHAETEETIALRGVSLAVAPGEVVAITGPSGSGKSTLLACLAGTDEPDGGTVSVGGERMTRRPEAARARLRARRVGVLFQQSNLIDHLDVRANIRLARRFAASADARPVDGLLAALGIAGRAHAYPNELSGGEIARAGLAVALANDPQVLLADEPTGELDATSAEAVLELLERQARQGAAVLIATHSDAIASAARRVVHLADGRLS